MVLGASPASHQAFCFNLNRSILSLRVASFPSVGRPSLSRCSTSLFLL